MVSQEQILDSMRHIIDPDLGKDIVSLGFIKNIKIEGGQVSFVVELTTPACPVKAQFKAACEEAVSQLPGVDAVEVTMGAMERKKTPASPDINTLSKVNAVIAISSCKGGVGKSTVAAHLARAIQKEGHRVGLLDADIFGPSIPTLFKLQQPQVYMKDNLIQPVEAEGMKTMSLGYLLGDQPAVMRGPMVSNYIMQILQQTDWGHLDYLIIDLPPGTGDIQLTLVQQAALDGAIIVTTPQALSLVDVARGILMFETVNVPVLGIVENMAYFTCDECDKKHFIFGNSTATLKQRFGLDTLAQLPVIPGVSDPSGADTAEAQAIFSTLADNLHREVGMRRKEGVEKPSVTIQPGALSIQWPDGATSELANKPLRASCQCARCVDEFTGTPILDADTIPDDLQAEKIQTLGNYAIAVTWSDGHSSGIFSWDHLREQAASQGV
jgi:Mrp family chromosome partitioning ATPase/DUF971 family protein